MKCLCCLSEKKTLYNFNVNDKKFYMKVIRTDFNLKRKSMKICDECHKQLKVSSNFIQKCEKSLEILQSHEETLEHKNSKRKSKTKARLIIEENIPEDLIVQEDHIDTHQDVSSNDIIIESETIEVIQQDESKSADDCQKSKKNKTPTKIWQCDTCGKHFATKFRLVTHISECRKY